MTTARQKVFSYLKKQRPASAAQIARALGMSPAAIRHHLAMLCGDRRASVVGAVRKDGRGRPEKIYSLSPELQGDNLESLVEALLAGTPDLEKIADRVVRSQGLAGPAGTQMAKRLTHLVEGLNRMQYQARWEAGAEGPRLSFGRCPYARVIERHPELCKMDSAILEGSLSRTVTGVPKTETTFAGQCPLIFLIG